MIHRIASFTPKDTMGIPLFATGFILGIIALVLVFIFWKLIVQGLFDVGFTRFVTNALVPFLWIASIIAHFFAAIAAISMAFVQSTEAGVLALFLVPLATLFSLLLSRVGFEVVIVLFRIETNTRKA